MKLSVSNIGWSKENEQRILEILKKERFAAIEVAPTAIINENPYDNIKRAVDYLNVIKKKYNIEICSMQSIWYGLDGNIFNQEDHEKLVNYTYKAINFANAINCKNIVFGCPKARNKKYENMSDDLATVFFKTICNYAKEKNVVIALEPNPKIYNTNFINTTTEAFDFVKKINLESFKVNIDFGTIIENGEDLEIIYRNIKYVNHIHISEPNLKKIQRRQLHREFIKKLKDIKYDKYLSIEMKKTDDINDLIACIKYLKEIYDEV